MTTLLKEKVAANRITYPLNVKKVMIGLELDDSDQALLEYFHFINQFLKAERINCIHVIPQPTPLFPLRAVYPETLADLDAQVHKQRMQAMEQELKSALPAEMMKTLNFSVERGSPLEILTTTTNDAAADLVLIGKRAAKERHVIQAMNLIRMVKANILLAPEKSRPVLKTILVPVDFSDYSVRALKTAVGFKHASLEPVRVLGLHVYQKPSLLPYTLGMMPVEYERNLALNHRRSLENFLAEKLTDFKEEIELLTVEHDSPEVALQVLNQAGKTDADLIVMGAKGHSKLATILLGSTTELLLRKNEEYPVLVVK